MHLQYNKTGSMMILGLVILGVLTAGFWQLPSSTLCARTLQNLLHIPLFVVISLLLLRLVASWQVHWLMRYGVVLILAMVLGLAIELLQGFTDRTVSFVDLVRDLIGISIGLLLHAAWQRRIHWGVALLLVTILLFRDGWDTGRLWLAYQDRDEAFPVILDLSQDWVDPFVRVNGAQRAGNRLTLMPNRYPGLTILEPYPDWSGYHTLEFEVELLQENDVFLVLRVHDAAHNQQSNDRFNRAFRLQPGSNLIQIPLQGIAEGPTQRRLDMQAITGVILYASHPAEPVQFALSPLVLR